MEGKKNHRLNRLNGWRKIRGNKLEKKNAYARRQEKQQKEKQKLEKGVRAKLDQKDIREGIE